MDDKVFVWYTLEQVKNRRGEVIISFRTTSPYVEDNDINFTAEDTFVSMYMRNLTRKYMKIKGVAGVYFKYEIS